MVKLDHFLRNLIKRNLEQSSDHFQIKIESLVLHMHLDPERKFNNSKINSAFTNFTIHIGTDGPQQEIIYSIMHEIGHFLSNRTLTLEQTIELRQKNMFCRSNHLVSSFMLEREVSAWEAGYKYFTFHGIPFPLGYTRRMIKSLSTYTAFAEEPDYWIDTIARRAAVISLKEGYTSDPRCR